MIRPAKIFEAAVKYQAEQNKNKAAAADDAVINGAESKTEESKNEARTAEDAGEKKTRRRVPSVRPKIGTLL